MTLKLQLDLQMHDSLNTLVLVFAAFSNILFTSAVSRVPSEQTEWSGCAEVCSRSRTILQEPLSLCNPCPSFEKGTFCAECCSKQGHCKNLLQYKCACAWGGGVHKFFNLLLKKKGASVSVRPPFDSYLIISQQAKFENLCHKFPNQQILTQRQLAGLEALLQT